MQHQSDSPIMIKIRSVYPDLKKAERRVADYILQNSETVIYENLAQSSKEAGVSEASFVRFCKNIGFSGFTDMRLALATTVGRKQQELSDNFELDRATPLEDIPARVVARSIHAMEDMLGILNREEYSRAVKALQAAERICIFGVANSASVGDDAMNKLLRLGKLAVATSDPHLQIMQATSLTGRDVAIGISHSGKTRQTIDALKIAKRAGAVVICITNHEASTITDTADIKLLTADYEKDFESETMTSRLSQLAIIDMLYLGVMLQDYDQYTQLIEQQNRELRPLAF